MNRNVQHSTFNIQCPRAPRRGRLLGCWAFLFFIFWEFSVSAQTNNNNLLPLLAPAYGEIKPTFWEVYGVAVVIAAAVWVLGLGLVAWMIVRPRPVTGTPPLTVAREALKPLVNQPETGELLSQISLILRRAAASAFGLPPGEMTTAEFSAALERKEQPGPRVAKLLTDFLRECDEQKFAATAPAPINAAKRAWHLISEMELAKMVDESTRARRKPPVLPGAANVPQRPGTEPQTKPGP